MPDSSQRGFDKDLIPVVNSFFSGGVKMNFNNGIAMALAKAVDMSKFAVVIRHDPYPADIDQGIFFPDFFRYYRMRIIGERIIIQLF